MAALLMALIGFFMVSAPLTSPVRPSDNPGSVSAAQPMGGSKRMTGVGVNLSAINYWGQEYPFINRFKTMNPWTAIPVDPNTSRFVVPTDANGYPIGQPDIDRYQALTPIEPVSAGFTTIYHLFYDGDANITFNGARVISDKPGEKVLDLAGSPGLITMYAGASGKLPTNLALVREDQLDLYRAGEIFNPTFIEKLRPFSEVRLMDFANTNANSIENWDDRTKVSQMSWAQDDSKSSVPFEVQIALANKLNRDVWVNIPAHATDDYVRKMLTYARDHLNAGLTIKIEYSNEVWNLGFEQSKYAADKARALWGEVHDGPMQYYGYRSAQIAAITKQVFAGNTDVTAQVVLGTQTGYHGREAGIVEGVARANLGNIGSLFDIYAVTNYFGTQFAGATDADKQKILGWARSGKAGLDAAFQELEFGGQLTNDMSLKVTLGWLDYQARFAKANGLAREVYEGGADLMSFTYSAADEPVVQAFFQQILSDPRIGTLYTKAINHFFDIGGVQWDAFTAFGGVSKWGDYGALASVYDAPTPRWEALVQAAAAAEATPGTILPPSPPPPPPVIDPGTTGKPRHDLAPLPTKPVADALIPPSVIGDEPDNVATLNTNFVLPTKSKTLTYIGEASFSGTGNALANTLTGGNADDRLLGLGGDDQLNGGAGNDILDGSDGNDVLDGGTGDDLMYGGSGDDRYYVDSDGDRISELAGGGTDTVLTTLATAGIGANLENLAYVGSAAFAGTGNDLANVIVGGNIGNKLYGNGGNDTLRGGDGVDELDGGSGDDALYGGAGDDRYYVDSAADQIFEGGDAGTDRVDTTVSYALPANVEQLFAQSSLGLTLTGNATANYINGSVGGDTLFGMDGDDVLFGREGDDVLDGGAGNDVLGGGDGKDILNGGLGDDTVNGGAGDDVLRGGGGCDVLSGEAGADIFQFCAGDLSTDLGKTVTIADFSRTDGDRFDFTSYDANTTTKGVDPFAFIGTAAFSKQAGELRIEKNAGRWIIQGDTDGDGVADFAVATLSKIQFVKSDFLI